MDGNSDPGPPKRPEIIWHCLLTFFSTSSGRQDQPRRVSSHSWWVFLKHGYIRTVWGRTHEIMHLTLQICFTVCRFICMWVCPSQALSPAGDLWPLKLRGQMLLNLFATEAGWSQATFCSFCSTCHWFCFQCSSGEAAGNNERDTENGHLIYKSGDVLEDRCRYQFRKTWQAQ